MIETFIYTYQDEKGGVQRGRIRSETAGQAKSFLNQRSIYPITLKKHRQSVWKSLFVARKVKADDVVIFTQLFSSCIRTGMTIKESLGLLSKQVSSRPLQVALEQILVEVESGTPISKAFADKGDLFPPFYAMLLKAGEASGDLSEVLEYLGAYLDRVNSLRKELIGIFTYPVIVTFIGFSLLTLILIFVAPTFREVFSQTGAPLPIATVILFGLSDIVAGNLITILSLLLVCFLGFNLYLRTEKGRLRWDEFLFEVPVLGPIIREVNVLRFLKSFEILINHNVPILEALKVIEDGATNSALRLIIKEMRHDVAKGLPISGPLLANSHIISPMVSYSVSMGEKSGSLGPTLHRLCQFIDREMSYSMKRLSSRLDPVLTMGLGAMVLFIALAIYLPIFDMMGTPK